MNVQFAFNEVANAEMSEPATTNCWSEVSALLTLAMPNANVTNLYREGIDDTQNADENVSHFLQLMLLFQPFSLLYSYSHLVALFKGACGH